MFDLISISVKVIYHTPEIESLFDSSSRLSYWMGQIQRVQYQAALAISGTWQGTNTDKIYEELGWESLTQRRWFRRLVQIFKNNLMSDYMNLPVPPLRVNAMGTRRGNRIPLVDAR